MPGSGQGRVGGREADVLADSAVMSVSVVFVKVLRLASVSDRCRHERVGRVCQIVMSVSVVFVKVLRLASVQPVPGVIRSNLGDATSRVLVVC